MALSRYSEDAGQSQTLYPLISCKLLSQFHLGSKMAARGSRPVFIQAHRHSLFQKVPAEPNYLSLALTSEMSSSFLVSGKYNWLDNSKTYAHLSIGVELNPR